MHKEMQRRRTDQKSGGSGGGGSSNVVGINCPPTFLMRNYDESVQRSKDYLLTCLCKMYLYSKACDTSNFGKGDRNGAISNGDFLRITIK